MACSLRPIFHCNAKIFALGPCEGLDPKRKIFKFALPPTQIFKFALPPTRNPNMSQWNIGCVGFQTQICLIGHVHFFLFCVDIICIGSHFSVEYGLKCMGWWFIACLTLSPTGSRVEGCAFQVTVSLILRIFQHCRGVKCST